MRILTGVLLIAAAVAQILIGGGALVSWRYELFMAAEARMARTGDLSAVSGDLVDEPPPASSRPEDADQGPSVITRQLVTGILALTLALALLLAGVLSLAGRGRRMALGIAAVGVGLAVGVAVAGRTWLLGGLGVLLPAVALVLGRIAWPAHKTAD